MISHPDLIQTLRQFMDLAMHHTMHERVHFAKAIGLSMPQLGVLLQLHYRGNCGVSDIGDRFDITNAAASQLVDKLVQSKLIQREEDPHDRRAKLLNLTKKAKELMQRNVEERYRWVNKLAEKLTPEESAKIVEALNILTQAAKELEAEPAQPAS
jgi:DNA-binding MarR family transcriptional regulator